MPAAALDSEKKRWRTKGKKRQTQARFWLGDLRK